MRFDRLKEIVWKFLKTSVLSTCAAGSPFSFFFSILILEKLFK